MEPGSKKAFLDQNIHYYLEGGGGLSREGTQESGKNDLDGSGWLNRGLSVERMSIAERIQRAEDEIEMYDRV